MNNVDARSAGRDRAERSGERGQALPLLAVALLVLLGVAALVVDLGVSWMVRRHEQDAADPAAVAAARYIRPTPDHDAMLTAACLYARENGFFPGAIDDNDCIPANDPEQATLAVNYPPVGAGAGAYEGRTGFVQVTITTQHDNFFSAIFGQPMTTVSASGIAAWSDGNSNSNSLIALDPTDCQSGRVDGSGSVSIIPQTDPDTGAPYPGGNVQVNATCGATSSPDDLCVASGSGGLSINGTGSGTTKLTAPSISVSGQCVTNGHGAVVTSTLTEGALQVGDPLAELAPPRFSDAVLRHDGQLKIMSDTTLDPGIYCGGWKISPSPTITLNPGIYIIAGGGISASSHPDITSAGGQVLIFSTDSAPPCSTGGAEGAISLTAGGNLSLTGMTSGPYAGLLLWQDGNAGCGASGTCPDIELGGQTSLHISGTIYAPKSAVILTGGSESDPGDCSLNCAAVQIISWTWKIGGNADLLMPYDPGGLYQLDQKGLVH